VQSKRVASEGKKIMDGTNQHESKPLGVLLIAGFYAFGAAALLIGLFINPIEVSRIIAERHGLLPSVGTVILPIVAALGLIMAYGLYSLSRWGFFLTIVYLIYFGGISIALGGLNFAQTGQEAFQAYSGNLIWSVLVIIYLVIVRQHFLTPKNAGLPLTEVS
jgi:hypothetical protein